MIADYRSGFHYHEGTDRYVSSDPGLGMNRALGRDTRQSWLLLFAKLIEQKGNAGVDVRHPDQRGLNGTTGLKVLRD